MWEKLRSNYRAQKSRLKKGQPSGSGGEKTGKAVKWKYWELMLFLDGFDENRRSISNSATSVTQDPSPVSNNSATRGRPKRGRGSGNDDFEMELMAKMNKATDFLDGDNKDSDEDFHFAQSVYAKLSKIVDEDVKFSAKQEIDVLLHNAAKRASGLPAASGGYGYAHPPFWNQQQGTLSVPPGPPLWNQPPGTSNGQAGSSQSVYGGFDGINYEQASSSHH